MNHKLPPLNYEFNALEPYMDAKTVEIHYSAHHQGYVNKLNAALEGHPELQEKSLKDLLKSLNDIPEDIRTAVRNNGGGTFNHNLYWKIMTPGGAKAPKNKLNEAINSSFNNFDRFKKDFTELAGAHFASGWAWLYMNSEKNLKISSTPNHDSPLMEGHTPLLVLDVWEHAYYLKYQNRRPEFIENWWNLINWDEVEKIYTEACQ
ncbi:superoxide dismutase [Candidatus Peregrinibacteria bacterium]|nr:superoxide dismutase [Candidatus Peregrinibacteria bacterium]